MGRKKKKQPWYYSKKVFAEFIYSAIFLASIAIFYFLILISVKPQSFPILTNKIEETINQNLPKNSEIAISKISVELDQLYKINIILENIDLNLEKDLLFLPKVTAQFSILDIITRQRPNKIGIENAKIKIDNKIWGNSIQKDNKNLPYQAYFKKIWDIFLKIRDKDTIARKFEVKNVEFIFNDKNNKTKNILIKSSLIDITKPKDKLVINTRNIFNLQNGNIDIRFNANCNFNPKNILQCDAGFFNVIPKSFAKIFQKFEFLDKIDAKLGASLDLEIDKNHELTSLIFNIDANKGSFFYKQFFEDRIDFTNLSANFETNKSLKNLQLSDLAVTFDDDIKFGMSMEINDFQNPELEETRMHFKIANASGSKIAKFWPAFLAPNIRNWVGNHIDQGLVKDAYANISFKRSNNIKKLQLVDSEVLFSKLRLKYSKDFPEITNIDGIASFSRDDMKIDIISGDVLESKIKSGKVQIKDFHAKQIMLDIIGIASGAGYDPLKHVDYDGRFAREIPEYINGYSDSSFDIKIPIKDNLDIKDFYIKVLSNIKNINSNYLHNNSAVNVSVLKKFNDNNFKTYIDLSNSKINFPQANIFKKKAVSSKATIDIIAKNSQLHLKNLDFLVKNSAINADILLNIRKSYINRLTIVNNLNNSNYTLFYSESPKESLRTLEINGNYLNLAHFLQNMSKIGKNSANDNRFENFIIKSNLKKVDLAHKEYFKNLRIDINCQKTLCQDGVFRSEMSDDNFVYIDLFQKKRKHDYTTIKANISDISKISRAFNISNKIIGGKTQIRARFSQDKYLKKSLKGSLEIKKGFSVIKSNIVDEIAKDNIFKKVKDALTKSDKINFNDLDLDFEIKDSQLAVSNLIASSTLLGFTAKGTIALSGENTILKGLVVPGYALNKLFGISHIPVFGKIILGEKGGGLFAARYRYIKNPQNKNGKFTLNAASAIAPGSTRKLLRIFD